MKKIINNPEKVVDDMLQGMKAAHPEIIEIQQSKRLVLYKNAPVDKKVGLVTGGGSGHEPAHGGYVGKGMLDAVCAGEVFTSPSVDAMFEAIKRVNSGEGVFCIIKNYTGDRINFEMAMEMAEDEGIKCDYLVVSDDVAVENSTYTTGRRGIAGTIFMHKIIGAAAADLKSLEELKLIGEKVNDFVRTMGVALSPCTIPASGKANFYLEDDEMEIGMGIHGEPGIKKGKILTANEIAKLLVDKIMNYLTFKENDEIAVLINGMGSTPLMELYILNNEVQKILKNRKLCIYKTLVGNYMTSLEMAGVSVTIMKLDNELKKYLDFPADTPALRM